MVSSSSSSSSSPAERSWKENLKHSYNVGMKDFVQPAVSSFSQLSNEARTSLTVVATVMLTLAGSRAYKRFVRRIPTTEDVPSHYIRDKKWIKGVVTRYLESIIECTVDSPFWFSVGDADNFRLYHTPGIGWRWPLKFRFVPKTAKGEYTDWHHDVVTNLYKRAEAADDSYTIGRGRRAGGTMSPFHPSQAVRS
jgi:hypothetical protein